MYLKILDQLFDTSDKLMTYIRNTENPDISLINTTFALLELQLQNIYKSHYQEIYKNDNLWCYYEAIVENITYLHYHIDNTKQSMHILVSA